MSAVHEKSRVTMTISACWYKDFRLIRTSSHGRIIVTEWIPSFVSCKGILMQLHVLFCINSTYCFHEYLNYSVIWQTVPAPVKCYVLTESCFVSCAVIVFLTCPVWTQSNYVLVSCKERCWTFTCRYPTICCSKLLKVTQLTQLHILLTGPSVPTQEWRRGTSL